MTKIIIDGLGADLGSAMVCDALKIALKQRKFEAVVVGPEKIFKDALSEYKEQLEFIDTEEYVTNEESPVFAIRKKKNSSIVLGLNRLNEDDADVILSAGSTGALLAGGYFITKRLQGFERACLAVIVPNPEGGTVLLDCGATMDTTPEILCQFAILGNAYAKYTLHRDNPRIGLLNVGLEEGKGDRRTSTTYQLLKEMPVNFIGNVEARSILEAHCDVIVADGYSGNIALKSIEGTAKTVLSALKKGILSGIKTKIGGLLLKSVFKDVLKDYNYKAYGGAPLLGIKKPLYKAHGNSSAETFALAINEALDFAESGMLQKISENAEREI